MASLVGALKRNPQGEVQIRTSTQSLGYQPVRLAATKVGLRITAIPPDETAAYESHLRRFLQHTDLRAVQWINIMPAVVQFVTVQGRG